MSNTMSTVARFAIALALAAAIEGAETSVTWTGWFSDLKCATSRANGGVFTETNPDCAKRCIEGGAPAAFISETSKGVYQIQNYPSAVEDLGYHVEIQGTLNAATKILTVQKVTRMEYQGASCGRPKKK